MAEPKLNVGIEVTAKDSTEDGLAAAKESIRSFQEAATEAATTFTASSDDIVKSSREVGESCSIAQHKILENAKEVREATRDYKVMNIEQMQFNQILQTTGTTATQWGAKLQGSHNLVNEATKNLFDTVNKATGGLMTYFGAGVQVLGQGIEMYAQVQRMVLMWGMHATAVATAAAVQDVNTVATGAAVAPQLALNTAMLANPAFQVAAGVAAIGFAIVGAKVAYDHWTNQNIALNKAVIELSDNIDQAKTKIRQLYEGEGTKAEELQKKINDLGAQYKGLEDRRAAAIALGLYDTSEEIGAQMAAVDEEKAILAKQLEMQKALPPEEGALKAAGADLFNKVKAAFIAEAQKRGDYWVAGGMDCPAFFDYNAASKDAEDYGQKYADAWVQGVRDGAYSASNQAIMADAAAKLGEDFKAESPPKTGPLHTVDDWGKSLMLTYGSGMLTGIPEIERSLAHEMEARLIPELNLKGGSSTVNNESRSTSVVNNNTFNISGVDEESIARAVVRRIAGS